MSQPRRLCEAERCDTHDVCEPLPMVHARFDACYSRMILCMVHTTRELARLSAGVRRVRRPHRRQRSRNDRPMLRADRRR